MEKQTVISGKYITILSGVLAFFGLYLTSLYSYLLFHSLAEIFSIVVACGIFMVALNSRRFLDNKYFLFIGIAYLFIGLLDLLHTLGYKGMGVFQGYNTNLSTQLWIAARYIESLTLLIAPLLIGRKLKISVVFICYTAVASLLIYSIFYWRLFPDCFVEGVGVEDVGLTPFKKISEYIISLILLASALLLFQKRKEFDEGVWQLLVASIIVTIASELAFTFYADAYGFFNLVGHFFKIISFYFIYKAIIETGFRKPYNLIFRDLKFSEEALRKRQQELLKLNRDLMDTNRGVLVLYSEVQEKVKQLQRANEMKTRFLSEASHELRTPLSSIVALAHILLDRLDGDLTTEQEKQITFMHESADKLLGIIHDLRATAMMETGKTEVYAAEFSVEQLFSSLRGMFRPLHVDSSVKLIFEEAEDLPPLNTDEGKVLQILRNLVSNSLKFTEQGRVSVSAKLATGGGTVVFSVEDTGIGISSEEQERIFKEYVQLDNHLQAQGEGMGLGLPLSRKLAELLGGSLTMESKPGVGTTFTAIIPIVYSKTESVSP